MGGSDDPSNLIELTIEEHAEAHRKLYEEHGRIQDKLAWLGLTRMIGREEIIHTLLTQPKSTEHRERISMAKKGKPTPWTAGNKNATALKGRQKSDDHKRKISEAHQGMSKPWLIGNKNGTVLKGRKRSDEHQAAINIAAHSDDAKRKKSESWAARPMVTCPHCGMTGKAGHNMRRYHFDMCKAVR